MILEQLKELEKESLQRGIPILGREKGTWLLQKILETKPIKILELGTANGYSGCILGSQGAKLTTIDINKALSEEAKNNFKTFKINATILLGDALEKIKKFQNKSFDLVFIDFAKKSYIKTLEDSIRILKKNGIIIADNITFPGCQNYKEAVLKDTRLKTEIIQIKDGLACSKKL